MDGRHVVATEHVRAEAFAADHFHRLGAGLEVVRILQQERYGAEADDEGQDVEVADEAGGVEHRLAGGLGVRHREEAHQDVRQAGGAEHQGQTRARSSRWGP